MKSPIRLPGAKSSEAHWLVGFVPSARVWVEPFFGAGHTLLAAIDTGGWTEFLTGELDPDAAHFWQQVAAGFAPEIAEVSLQFLGMEAGSGPDSIDWAICRAQLTEALDMLTASTNPIERAAAWFVRNRVTFNGGANHASITHAAYVQKFTPGAIARLRCLRLPNTRVIQGDYRETLALAPKDAAIFLDPPYLTAANLYQGHRSFDFPALAATAKSLRQPWVMTLDDCPEVRELFEGCHFYPWEKWYPASQRMGRELIISPDPIRARSGQMALSFC